MFRLSFLALSDEDPRPDVEPLPDRIRSLFAGTPTPTLDLVADVIAGLATPAVEPGLVPTLLDDLASTAPSIDSVADLLRFVFSDLGFRGNRQDYYDPGNSYLHQVIERRLGIPITLSLVAIEIGRRWGQHLEPIGFPGHLLLGQRDGRLFYDTFEGGRPVGRAECGELLHRQFPDAILEDGHLAPMTASEVALRMVGNLKQIHLAAGDISATIRAAEIGAALPDAPVALVLELAKLLSVAGRFDHAAALHARLVQLDPGHAAQHQQALTRLRAHQN